MTAVVEAIYFRAEQVDVFTEAGVGRALWAPSKVIHDFGVYPATLEVLGGMSLPLLMRNPRHWSWHAWALLACLGAWTTLTIIDFRRGLSPFLLNPLWNAASFRPFVS